MPQKKKDPDFTCLCSGAITLSRTLANGRKIFHCRKCHPETDIPECAICRKPRTLWANKKQTFCAPCWLKVKGELIALTKDQMERIAKWGNYKIYELK